MKLKLVSRNESQAWYRTADGAYDVLGFELHRRSGESRWCRPGLDVETIQAYSRLDG